MENKITKNAGKLQKINPSVAQSALRELVKKEQTAANQWESKWGFYRNNNLAKIVEDEGIGRDTFNKLIEAMYSKKYLLKKDNNVKTDKAAGTIVWPKTSAGFIGNWTGHKVEMFGRLVKTEKDYPLIEPDPPEQTIIFLG